MSTVVEVAAHAGVSPMTVSRVLSGDSHVREETRSRVERSIRALGYHRNENARNLRQRSRAGVIGVIVTNLANPYYSDVLEGIEEEISPTRRRMLIAASHEDSALERELVDDFLGRQVDGMIVVPAGSQAGHLGRAHLGRIPLVLASRAVEGVEADAVLVDDFSGAHAAAIRLIEEGHRRIGFLGNATSMFTMRRRLAGFTAALEEHGLSPDPSIIRSDRHDVSSAQGAMAEMLRLADPPTAVFTTNNRNTIGALRAMAAAAGRRVRVAGFDEFELSDLVQGPMTIVDHDARELGRTAAILLLDRLRDPAQVREPRIIELPTRLVEHDGR